MALVDVQQTPNPQARRFMVDHVVQETPRGRAHTRQDEDGSDAVIAAILAIEGVQALLTLPSSVTVTIDEGADWQVITPAVSQVLASTGP